MADKTPRLPVQYRGSYTLFIYRIHAVVMPLVAGTFAVLAGGWLGALLAAVFLLRCAWCVVGVWRSGTLLEGNHVIVRNPVRTYRFRANEVTLYVGGKMFWPGGAAVIVDQAGGFAVMCAVSKTYPAFVELQDDLHSMGACLSPKEIGLAEQVRRRMWSGSKSNRIRDGHKSWVQFTESMGR